jgi:hypothetical protein
MLLHFFPSGFSLVFCDVVCDVQRFCVSLIFGFGLGS